MSALGHFSRHFAASQRDVRFSDRPVGSTLSDYPPLQSSDVGSRLVLLFRNRHQGPPSWDFRGRGGTIFAAPYHQSNPEVQAVHATTSSSGHATIAFFMPRPGDLHRPGLEPGPFLRTHHALSRLIEHRPHHLVSQRDILRPNRPRPIDTAHVNQDTAPTDLDFGTERARRRSLEGQRRHRSHPRDCHQPPAHLVLLNNGQ